MSTSWGSNPKVEKYTHFWHHDLPKFCMPNKKQNFLVLGIGFLVIDDRKQDGEIERNTKTNIDLIPQTKFEQSDLTEQIKGSFDS